MQTVELLRAEFTIHLICKDILRKHRLVMPEADAIIDRLVTA